MNQIVLMGRLVRDPELRHTQSGTAVASFTLAVDRPYSKDREREADFIDCVAWQQRGEFVSKYFTKGQMCAVTGRLQLREWTDKEGNKRRSAEVVCDNVYFTESKKSRESGGGYSAAPARQDYNSGYAAPAPVSDFAELDEDDGDLPF
ncbi:MAG: single-stranded DNA-binding protein [Oscillospiraceae bacterium]|nr:single-stranded DNA-binding protein [Oscillospiraceae bacterium]